MIRTISKQSKKFQPKPEVETWLPIPYQDLCEQILESVIVDIKRKKINNEELTFFLNSSWCNFLCECIGYAYSAYKDRVIYLYNNPSKIKLHYTKTKGTKRRD